MTVGPASRLVTADSRCSGRRASDRQGPSHLQFEPERDGASEQRPAGHPGPAAVDRDRDRDGRQTRTRQKHLRPGPESRSEPQGNSDSESGYELQLNDVTVPADFPAALATVTRAPFQAGSRTGKREPCSTTMIASACCQAESLLIWKVRISPGYVI